MGKINLAITGCMGRMGQQLIKSANKDINMNLNKTIKASLKLAEKNIKALIEPINTVDQPGFFINTSKQGMDLIEQINHHNAFLLYDVYHMQIMEGDLIRTITELFDSIGHIQIADNPGRYEPGTGEINYPAIFNLLDKIGYSGWVGCEYKPSVSTIDSLTWMKNL